MVIVKGRMHGRMRWLGIALGLASMLTLALASGAQAKGEYELNDSRETAYGPLAGDVWYTAEIDTDNDADWYLFYVTTPSQLTFEAEAIATIDCNVVSILRDGDGELVSGFDGLATGPLNVTEKRSMTLTPGRYYLVANDSLYCPAGNRYKFRIRPASALTTSRECGEAIVAKGEAAPELANVAGLLAGNASSLAKVDEVIARQEVRLDGLTKHWRLLKRKWNRNFRKISRSNGTRYRKARARQRLSASKRSANQRLAIRKRQPKAKLEKAVANHADLLAKRSALEALEAQHAAAVSAADRVIADHC